ncbi:glycosyltransferase [Reichenbachiella sp. MALMAid0571]|uniref:glycosyltransferase n=1 Tax=Reichenbachiella sp. MALMAid0571 TaxID=3143939 RepID=UPI0032DFA56A
MIYVTVGVMILFIFFALWIMSSWFSMKTTEFGDVRPEPKKLLISVLIPVRNEGLNIENTLDSILKNRADPVLYEVIVIDDHSDDNTNELVESITEQHMNVKLIHLGDELSGKKKAIEAGVLVAGGDVILCTDGDCKVPEYWIQCYLEAYIGNPNSKLIFGGVRYESHGNYLVNLLNIELSILVIIGAATMKRGIPTMINGANFSYKREVFLAVDGYQGNENIPSGDDEFLLRKVKNKFQDGIYFLKNPNSIVETTAPDSLKKLIDQRRRWGAKWKYHQDIYSKLIPILIFLINVSALWAMFEMALLSNVSYWLTFLASKAIIDFLFMRIATKFLDVKSQLLSFFLLEIIYPFYVVFFAIASNFGKYSWKGRVYGN